MAPSTHYYLDCGYGNQYGKPSWCGGMKSWREIWNLDPHQYVQQDNEDQVLGGEVCMWSEMNNEHNVSTKLFPRAAAMAFRHWSPRKDYNQGQAMEMIIRFEYRLKRRGLPTEQTTMRFCEKHLHRCFG